MSNLSSDLIVLGLGLQILSLFFLSKSFLCTPFRRVVISNTQFWNGNPFKIQDAVVEWIDGRIGTVLTSLSLIFQMFGYFFENNQSEIHSDVVIPLLLSSTGFCLLFEWIHKKRYLPMVKSVELTSDEKEEFN